MNNLFDSIIQKDKELLVFLNNLGSEQWDSFWLLITNQFNWTPLFLLIFYLVIKSFGWIGPVYSISAIKGVNCKELTYDIMTFIEQNKKIQNEIVISE